MLVLRRLFWNWEESDMVEWKKLGDVCNFQNGYAFKSGLFKEIGLPIIRITNISDRSVNLDDCKYFNFEDYKGVNLDDFIIRKGDILVAMSGATTGKIGFYNHSNISYLNQRVGKFIPHEEMLENRYLYHFLLSQYKVIYIMAGGGAQPNLSSNKLLNDLFIPIPSKSEQERIVSILDTFTSSISNLKEQIKERRKQYEYYRDQLLDLEGKDGVEMKTLGEIGEFIRGTGIQKADFVEDGFPCIHYGQIHTKYGLSANSTLSNVNEALYHRSRKAEYGDVVLATTSEDAECVAKPVAWLGKEKVAISGDAYIFHHKENGKYMAHLFSSHRFFLFKIKHATGAKVVRISGDNMAKFEFPLPSLQEQLRIVTILDQFEASIANLEAQLKEREKQYEYYRNQLLTFE